MPSADDSGDGEPVKVLALALVSLSFFAGEAVLRAERDVPRPERIRHAPAKYPPLLGGVFPPQMGVVTLPVELNEEGRPTDIKILSGKPLLDRAAIDAVREWRYRPTIVEGTPRRVALVEAVDVFPSEKSRADYYGKILNDAKAPKPSRFVAIQRLEAIGLGQKEVVKALEKAAKDPDEYIREAANALLHTPERPPQILQIYRDPVKPGSEDAYRAVEEDAARICARLEFPNPHLAMESLTGPKEVWWLNAFASEAERQRVTDDYKRNSALVAALEGIATRKQGLTGAPVDVLTAHRADLSGGVPWNPAGARFFVVTVTRQSLQARASVFEAPDGTRYVLRPVRTRRLAEVEAAAWGGETRVFAVRPYWGLPAKEWIAADPEFWKANPRARRD